MNVVVTGAASGIGRATCLRLARDAKARGEAARVAAVDLGPSPGLDRLGDELRGLGAEVLALPGDMATVDGPARVVADAIRRVRRARRRREQQEFGRDGIRVNSVSPGMVRTGMTAKVYENREITEARNALGPDARYANGHDLVVDGGVSGNLLGRLPGISQITRS